MSNLVTTNPLLFAVLLTGGILVLVASILTIVFTVVYRVNRPDPRIVQEGIPAEATILRTWTTGSRLNQRYGVGMELEVRRPDMAPYQVKTRAMISVLRMGDFKPGTV